MQNEVVSREEWLEARRALLAKEKEATRLRDSVNAARLALPWVKVDKDYVFETPEGRKSLAKGRNEDSTMNFVRRHDEYEEAAKAPSCCH
ncbi:DUF899 family protein [Rhizobium laguerreae]|nr:DUF899 family protein [Rhizobium laguerreae]MBY3391596.1 DUF899 family protein [Rhizobium laguerreae]